jgi:hypothetical protein
MFVQVIEGHVSNRDGMLAGLEKWRAELAPGATGFLGATAGIAAENSFVSIVRFESEDAARANSDRPEQGEWWESFRSNLSGDVRFTNCPEVDTFGAGGSDDAGFVQVIIGRADRDKLRPVAEETDALLQRTRPDVIGGIVAWPGDGSFIQVVYFTSEEEARAAEKREPDTDEEREAWERMNSLMEFERFIDISEPMLFSA